MPLGLHLLLEVDNYTCNFESFEVAWRCYRLSFLFSSTGSPVAFHQFPANFLYLLTLLADSWYVLHTGMGCLNLTCMPVECFLVSSMN